ncbi:MAG: hypothetical protein SFZ02_09700 [bacterium]|nr:hypothetical protein [bacterium]
MNRYFRIFLFAICVFQAVATIALLLQIPFFTEAFPLPDTTPISFIFLSSILFAAFASTIWCLLTREDGALAGIGLDYIAIFVPVVIFSFQLASQNNKMIPFALACLVFTGLGVLIFIQTAKIPIRDTRPMPTVVKFSFAFFVIALMIVGGLLIFKTPNILPWRITPEFGVISGWFFLGAAGYFAYALVHPSWHNTAGQLIGFLAYDVILIIPFLQRLPTISDELRLSLLIYLGVVIYSGLLAIYYLFINSKTRIWQTHP